MRWLKAFQRVFRQFHPLELLFFVIWFTYSVWFWSHALYYDANGAVLAGHENVWGDGAAHLTMISTTAFRDTLIPDQSPLLINYPYSYPFAGNFLTGLVVRAGMPIITAFRVMGLLISFSAVLACYVFLRTLLKSWKVALLALFLFLTNGGLGWWLHVQDILGSSDMLHTLINPAEYYTHIPTKGLDFINVVHSMLFTQRAYTLGLLVMTASMAWLLHLAKMTDSKNMSITRVIQVVGLGILLGLMPIIHTHSFLFLFGWLAVWSIFDLAHTIDMHRKKPDFKSQLLKRVGLWSALAIATTIVASALLFTFFNHNIGSNFIRWQPGWYAPEQGFNVVSYWLWNWGVVPIIGVVSWVLLFIRSKQAKTIKQNLPLLSFGASGIIWFVLCNLIIWQPNIWDNTKLLAWVNLAFSALFAGTVQYIWQYTARFSSRISRKAVRWLAILVILISSASGLLDIYRVARVDMHTHRLFSAEDLELADWVREHTDPDTTWLASDKHNHWLSNLTGRQVLMAYRGWLWTHGYDYGPVEKDMGQLFENPAENQNLFTAYELDYAVLGPQEITTWQANVSAYNELFPIVKKTRNYTIYQLR